MWVDYVVENRCYFRPLKWDVYNILNYELGVDRISERHPSEFSKILEQKTMCQS